MITFFGILLLVVGWSLGWLFRVVPPANSLFWLFAVLAVCLGLLAVWHASGVRIAIAGTLLSACIVWLAVTTIWPQEEISPQAQQELKAQTPDKMIEVPVDVPSDWQVGVFAQERILHGPDGINAQLFASQLGPARFMTLHPAGVLLVSVPQQGKILALPDRDKDGFADQVIEFAAGLDRPHGLAVRSGNVIVAETGRLLSLPDSDRDLRADRVDVLSDDLPSGGGHWTRSVVVGNDASLFVSAGSSCNVCEEEDWRRAAVLKFEKGDSQAKLFAKGLRNSVGMAFHPKTGQLWASDNGRDMLGDNLPPDEINLVVSGGDYGWPYCYGKRTPDPEFGREDRCRNTVASEVMMQAHSAPLGITFAHDLDAPDPISDMLLVAFHGSWNRRVPTGYKLVGIPFADGRPAGEVQDLITGWLVDHQAWGRPVAPLVGTDGALYLSDDRAGAVYRFSWDKALTGN